MMSRYAGTKRFHHGGRERVIHENIIASQLLIGKGIVFDFDGTLADTLPDLTDAFNVGLESFGLQARSVSEISGYI